jgi:hypothetical protein
LHGFIDHRVREQGAPAAIPFALHWTADQAARANARRNSSATMSTKTSGMPG